MINILVSIIILAIAIFFQIHFFRQTQSTRKGFKNIFPDNIHNALSTYKDSDSKTVQIKISEDVEHGDVFSDIISCINNYLKKNKGAAEFSILKDITDRNCDAVEEQIEATSPFPIYVGLCGTLIGIVFGVAILGYGGGIDSLLTTSAHSTEIMSPVNTDAGAIGIKDLLRGVAVAMLTTFIGVILTIMGASASKGAAKENEFRKNIFLSWMQGELLPQMNNSIAKTIDILQQNLSKFNSGFAENSKNLNDVFANITTTINGQAKVLQMVDKLKINDIATANINVLKELQLCTDKITLLQEFLNQSNQYLVSVQSLNSNLANQYDRTMLIENMGKFFMDEIYQIEARKDTLSKFVGDIDLSMQKAFEELSNHTHEQYTTLTNATAKEHNEFIKAVEEQQTALNTKLNETTQLIDELKNLTALKASMNLLVEQGEVKKDQLDDLLTIKSSLCELSISNNKQNELMSRLNTTLDNLPISQDSGAYNKPVQNDIVSKSIILMAAITSIVIIGTCIFYICNTIL